MYLNEMRALGESKVLNFLFLVLIKGMEKRGESKISLCFSRSLGASLQSLHKRGGIIWYAWSVCK